MVDCKTAELCCFSERLHRRPETSQAFKADVEVAGGATGLLSTSRLRIVPVTAEAEGPSTVVTGDDSDSKALHVLTYLQHCCH